MHTERFGLPASINIELVLADASQLAEAEAVLQSGLERLGEEPLPAAAGRRPEGRKLSASHWRTSA